MSGLAMEKGEGVKKGQVRHGRPALNRDGWRTGGETEGREPEGGDALRVTDENSSELLAEQSLHHLN